MSQAQYKKIVRSWCLYDWANSAFATTVMAALYGPFFRSLAQNAGMDSARATAYFGYTVAAALLVVALLGPVLGAMADFAGQKKKYVAVFAVIGIGATAAFTGLGADTWIYAAVLYAVANVGFAGANVFYDSLLVHVAKKGDADRVSAMGYALGYVGGGVLLLINFAWLAKPQMFGLAGTGAAVKASFLSVALWWGFFSIPFFKNVSEPPPSGEKLPFFQLARTGFSRVGQTLKHLRSHRDLWLFLMAFWLYMDGIGTIMKMATAYGDEIGITSSHMLLALALTQLVGIPATLAFGRLAGKIGSRNGIFLGLLVYACISLGGFFMKTSLHFFILAGCVGLVQGGCQALSRSLFAAMTPPDKASEFFGFFSFSSKMAGVLGPLLFGVVTQVTGNSRLSIVSLVVLFLGGALILSRVDVEKGKHKAGNLNHP